MANPAVYVKLDQESYDRLTRLSKQERRMLGDQAAILLRKILAKWEAEQTDTVAA